MRREGGGLWAVGCKSENKIPRPDRRKSAAAPLTIRYPLSAIRFFPATAYLAACSPL